MFRVEGKSEWSKVKSWKFRTPGPLRRGSGSGITCRTPDFGLWTSGLFIFVFLMIAGVAQGATLVGTVFDPSGRPMPGVQVSLLERLVPLDERECDSQGRYRFDGVRGGTYRLVANAPGFSVSTTEVDLGDDETRAVDLHLQLSAVEQQVVVSASLAGALAPQLGSSVSVITSREMEERGAENLLEGLRGVPGVEVNQTGRRGSVTGVFVRGGNSNYNLVMVDGIQVNAFGGEFDFSPVPVDGVDHVEVTRGPQSALYGSNAVASAINIVSRRGVGPPHFSFLEEAGSFTTVRSAAGASGRTRGLGWAVDVSRFYSGGVVQNDRYRNQSAFLSLDYRRSERRWADLHFFGIAHDAGAPGPFGSDPDHLFSGIDLISGFKQNLFGYQGGYAEQLSPRFRQDVRGSVSTSDYYFPSPFGDSFSNNLRGILNTQSEVTVSSRDFLVAGVEYNREQIRNTFIAGPTNTPFLLPRIALAYFAENRWTPTRRWYLTTGLRVDDIETRRLPPDAFGSRPVLPASSIVKVNPRVSVAYLAHEGGAATRLHGSFGTGIRAPNGFELAFTNNPRLKPEKSISLDSGVEERFLSNRANLDVTYFYSQFKDQIVVLGGSLTNLSTFKSDNLANARAQGMEVSFRVRPTGSLELGGEYTLLESAVLALDRVTVAQFPFRVGQPLIRRPRNSGAYNLTWRRGRLMLNTNAYIRSHVLDIEPNLGAFACTLGLECLFRNKGYIRAGAGFSYRLVSGFEIYGRLNNFLNQKYEESFGFPALHLNFLAGIKFNFPAE